MTPQRTHMATCKWHAEIGVGKGDQKLFCAL